MDTLKSQSNQKLKNKLVVKKSTVQSRLFLGHNSNFVHSMLHHFECPYQNIGDTLNHTRANKTKALIAKRCSQ